MIYGTRVRLAREFREMQQKELAEALGVSPSRLTQIERADPGEITASQKDDLVAHLRMPAEFFSMPPREGLGEGSMRFRAQTKVPKRTRSAARREADLAVEMVDHLLHRVEMPAARLPSLSASTDLEEAAYDVRAALGIAPDVVIPRVLHVLERAGVIVVAITTRVDGSLDGFSTWWGPEHQHPVIALSEAMSWDRYRLTAMHELAHLTLHRGAGTAGMDGRRIERDAHRFAGAILFPRDAALEEFPERVTLNQLLPLKQRWGLSVGALIARARDLELIDERQTTNLWKQRSGRGWNRQEPLHDHRLREQPRALKKMAEVAYGTDYVSDLARGAGRYRADVVTELERYAEATGRGSDRRSSIGRDAPSTAKVIDLSSARR